MDYALQLLIEQVWKGVVVVHDKCHTTGPSSNFFLQLGLNNKSSLVKVMERLQFCSKVNSLLTQATVIPNLKCCNYLKNNHKKSNNNLNVLHAKWDILAQKKYVF